MFVTRTFAVALSLFVFACGSSEPEGPPSPEQEYSDIAWKLKTALDTSIKCPEIAAAVMEWEKAHGERFAELVASVPKLVGGHASNVQRMLHTFEDVAGRCVNPKQEFGDLMMREPNIARVYATMPDMELGFEMR